MWITQKKFTDKAAGNSGHENTAFDAKNSPITGVTV